MIHPSERFAEVYTRRLAAEVAAHPEEYGYTVAEVPAVAGKMLAALAKGSANKEGRAIRGTCRELGIPYTYAGLRAYTDAQSRNNPPIEPRVRRGGDAVIRARFYLGTRAFEGNDGPHYRRMAVGWTVMLRRIDEASLIVYDQGMQGATFAPAVGLWNGDLEPSIVVESIGDYTAEHVARVAEALREAYDQDTVLWTIEPIHSGTANRTEPKG